MIDLKETFKKPISQQITELRKTGKLEDAFELSESLPKEDLKDIWNKRAVSWVYYAYLKKYAADTNTIKFLEFFQKIKDLNLAEDEKMLFDNLAFPIYALISKHFKNSSDVSILDNIFNLIKDIPFTKEQTSYSVLFKAFQKGKTDWSKYIEFVDWWGVENFIKDDYLPFVLENGKSIMSLVEQAYIGYAKRIIQKLETPLASSNEKEVALSLANDFLWKLSNLIVIHPEYKYPSYYKAKLLILTGGDDVLKAIKPFAKKMKHSFWVWDLMSDIFPKEDDKKMACLCKAITLETNDSFIIIVRKKLLSVLIENKLYSEAKKEIELIEKTISKNDWKIDAKIVQIKNNDWFINAESTISNNQFYTILAKKANLILLDDIPGEYITITFVNTNKKMINYISNQKKEGFFMYKGIIDYPKIGEVYKVQMKAKGTEGFQDLFSAEKNSSDKSTVLKEFNGEINITEKGFGFVNDVFFPKSFIEKHQILQSQLLEGNSIVSFNKAKNKYGLVVLSLKVNGMKK